MAGVRAWDSMGICVPHSGCGKESGRKSRRLFSSKSTCTTKSRNETAPRMPITGRSETALMLDKSCRPTSVSLIRMGLISTSGGLYSSKVVLPPAGVFTSIEFPVSCKSGNAVESITQHPKPVSNTKHCCLPFQTTGIVIMWFEPSILNSARADRVAGGFGDACAVEKKKRKNKTNVRTHRDAPAPGISI